MHRNFNKFWFFDFKLFCLPNYSNERAKPRTVILTFKLNGRGSRDPSAEHPTVVRQRFFVSLALCNFRWRGHGLAQIDLMSPSLQASADPPSTWQLHYRMLYQRARRSRCNLPEEVQENVQIYKQFTRLQKITTIIIIYWLL